MLYSVVSGIIRTLMDDDLHAAGDEESRQWRSTLASKLSSITTPCAAWDVHRLMLQA